MNKILLITGILLIFKFNLNAQGPNAPEASAFEPVDATDMVNLVTGDLSYVLPILNIPSPEGGYPIALSYHAGIALDQEASWVGLGWSLNPGAINREISGIPDDWKDGLKSKVSRDIGGETTINTASIGVGWGNDESNSIGVTVNWSANRAFGGETSYNYSINLSYQHGNKDNGKGWGVSVGYNSNGKIGVGASVGISGETIENKWGGYTTQYGSLGLSLGDGLGISLS